MSMKSLIKIVRTLSLSKRVIVVLGLVGTLLIGGTGYALYASNVSNSPTVAVTTGSSKAKNSGQEVVAVPTQKTTVVEAPKAETTNKAEEFPNNPGPTTGNVYKLNKDGQMPTITKRSFIVSPPTLVYDGTIQSVTFTATTDDGRLVSGLYKYPDGGLPYYIMGLDSFDYKQHASYRMAVNMSGFTSNQDFVATFMTITGDDRGNEIQYYGSVNVKNAFQYPTPPPSMW